MVPLYLDVLDNEMKLGESLCAPAQWFESRDLTCDGPTGEGGPGD